MWRLYLPRAVIGLLVLGYLFGMIASHWIPLSSVLEWPVGLAGWLAIAVQVVFAVWLYPWLPGGGDGVTTRSGMRWLRIMHLAFFAAAAVAFCFAVTGNLSLACPQHATSCVKIDNWKMSGGRYYRQHPYDSAGDDDPGAAWIEISRPEYVAEVGTHVREGAPFDVGMLCIAWVMSWRRRGIRRNSRIQPLRDVAQVAPAAGPDQERRHPPGRVTGFERPGPGGQGGRDR